MPLGSFLLGRYHLMTVMTTSCTLPMRTDDMLPNTIILDTANFVRALRQMAQEFEEYPEFTEDVTQEIIERLLDRRNAKMLLTSFVRDIRMGKFALDEERFAQIDPVYADAVESLCLNIYFQLKMLKAYMPDGRLPYHFHLPHVPQNQHVNDIMLTRTRSIPIGGDQFLYAKLLSA